MTAPTNGGAACTESNAPSAGEGSVLDRARARWRRVHERKPRRDRLLVSVAALRQERRIAPGAGPRSPAVKGRGEPTISAARLAEEPSPLPTTGLLDQRSQLASNCPSRPLHPLGNRPIRATRSTLGCVVFSMETAGRFRYAGSHHARATQPARSNLAARTLRLLGQGGAICSQLPRVVYRVGRGSG